MSRVSIHIFFDEYYEENSSLIYLKLFKLVEKISQTGLAIIALQELAQAADPVECLINIIDANKRNEISINMANSQSTNAIQLNHEESDKDNRCRIM